MLKRSREEESSKQNALKRALESMLEVTKSINDRMHEAAICGNISQVFYFILNSITIYKSFSIFFNINIKLLFIHYFCFL